MAIASKFLRPSVFDNGSASRWRRRAAPASSGPASAARSIASANAAASPGGDDDRGVPEEGREFRPRRRGDDDAPPAGQHAAELGGKNEIGRVGRLRQDMDVGEPQEFRQPRVGLKGQQPDIGQFGGARGERALGGPLAGDEELDVGAPRQPSRRVDQFVETLLGADVAGIENRRDRSRRSRVLAGRGSPLREA